VAKTSGIPPAPCLPTTNTDYASTHPLTQGDDCDAWILYFVEPTNQMSSWGSGNCHVARYLHRYGWVGGVRRGIPAVSMGTGVLWLPRSQNHADIERSGVWEMFYLIWPFRSLWNPSPVVLDFSDSISCFSSSHCHSL